MHDAPNGCLYCIDVETAYNHDTVHCNTLRWRLMFFKSLNKRVAIYTNEDNWLVFVKLNLTVTHGTK